MVDTVLESEYFPVNSNGEIILQQGVGDYAVAGYLHSSKIPSDYQSGKMVVKLPYETAKFAIDGSGNVIGLIGPDGQVVTGIYPFDVYAFYPGSPSASAKVLNIPIARNFSFKANFIGSYGKASVAATASAVFDVQKNGASIGSITFALGSANATFTTTGGAAQTFSTGDILSIIAPATPDTTLSDPSFVLVGLR